MRVGVPQALFQHFFPGVVGAFRERHPDTELAFFERDTALAGMMESGALDVCLGERCFGDPGVSQVLLGEYRLALVCPTALDMSLSDPAQITGLRERTFITDEPGQTIRARAMDFLSDALGEAPRATTTVSGPTSVMCLVAAGLGYAVVPEGIAAAQLDLITSVVLNDLQTVKVYFGCSAFLAQDPLGTDMRETCRAAMGFKGAVKPTAAG